VLISHIVLEVAVTVCTYGCRSKELKGRVDAEAGKLNSNCAIQISSSSWLGRRRRKITPYNSLTLRICIFAGRRCERTVRCAHSVFRLQTPTPMPMHTALSSEKQEAPSILILILNSRNKGTPPLLRDDVDCVFSHLTATTTRVQARLPQTLVINPIA
jgi:hypothetical protein